MKILIDTDELVEFFGEGWDSYDICSKAELRAFLERFCKQKIEGEEEKEEPTKNETCPAFDSITYFTRDQAQKHLEVLRDTIRTSGKVSVQDYYRLAEYLGIIQKWIAMNFKSNYGWKDLSTARINAICCKGNYLWTLEMPVPKKFDI